jgi:hypothetical protein
MRIVETEVLFQNNIFLKPCQNFDRGVNYIGVVPRGFGNFIDVGDLILVMLMVFINEHCKRLYCT